MAALKALAGSLAAVQWACGLARCELLYLYDVDTVVCQLDRPAVGCAPHLLVTLPLCNLYAALLLFAWLARTSNCCQSSQTSGQSFRCYSHHHQCWSCRFRCVFWGASARLLNASHATPIIMALSRVGSHRSLVAAFRPWCIIASTAGMSSDAHHQSSNEDSLYTSGGPLTAYGGVVPALLGAERGRYGWAPTIDASEALKSCSMQ